MKLADLRKIAIRKQVRFRFPLNNGMECVINERGVAQVPALKAPPEFNLEEELSRATTFVMETVAATGARNTAKPTAIGREELAGIIAESRGAAPARDDHEDD
jgi:hypothetical protein